MESSVENLKPLTSLRFVAAMMVVFSHARGYYGGEWSWLNYIPGTGAVFGVSFFFMLSGFILTHVYRSKPSLGYGQFILTRIARLWPVHVFSLGVLVLSVGPDAATLAGSGMFGKWVTLPINLAMLQSAVPTVSYIFSWNAVSWSISVEFFFYLMFPLLLVNIEKTWPWKVALFAVMAGASYPVLTAFGIPFNSDNLNTFTSLPVVYASPIGRGFEFCVGMSAWVIWSKYIRPISLSTYVWSALEAAALILVAAWFASFSILMSHVPQPISQWTSESSASIPLAILIIAVAPARGVIGKFLSLTVFVWLGEISFSIYMLHQVLLRAFANLPKQYVSEWTLFGAIFALSAVSYVFIEKPGKSIILSLMSRGRRNRIDPIQRRPPVMAGLDGS